MTGKLFLSIFYQVNSFKANSFFFCFRCETVTWFSYIIEICIKFIFLNFTNWRSPVTVDDFHSKLMNLEIYMRFMTLLLKIFISVNKHDIKTLYRLCFFCIYLQACKSITLRAETLMTSKVKVNFKSTSFRLSYRKWTLKTLELKVIIILIIINR